MNLETLRNYALVVVKFIYNILRVGIPIQKGTVKLWTKAIEMQEDALTSIGNILRSLVGLPPSVPKEPKEPIK